MGISHPRLAEPELFRQRVYDTTSHLPTALMPTIACRQSFTLANEVRQQVTRLAK